jgi:dethiobiotin synthetase
MTKKIFITGTGTDVGKTYISALIVKKMRESGYNCGYFKPVISGVNQICGHIIESDANYVIQTADIPTEPEKCVSYWWQEPVSPHLASKRKNQEIDIDKIKYDYAQINKKYDYLLIEGAGGITCPLIINKEEKYLLKDLIWELGLNIIIVADAGLGTINSTLLTIDYAKSNGIEIEGIILNNYETDNFMHWDNLETIETLTGINVVATVTKGASDIMLLEGLFQD